MKTVIEMAKEAGDEDWGLFVDFMPEIERFSELVRAAERKQFANECIELVAMYGGPVDLEAAIRARINT